MSYTFKQATRAFKNDKIRELSQDATGYRFLLLRSFSRSAAMRRLASSCNIDLSGIPAKDILQHLFEHPVITEDQIQTTIRDIYAEQRAQRREKEAALISELYRLHSFDWGGLHQNSLERTIINNYVKKITRFDTLCKNIDDRLFASMRAYVLCSWYNHWTSIIIEDIFKDHPAVLPAVGLIKKVDFFINGIPFDLKVTYLPEGFIKKKRQEAGQRPELTLLRQFARSHGMAFDADLPDTPLIEDLWTKVRDHPNNRAGELVSGLRRFRDALVDECVSDPSELIRWLYENQGVRRFDAANRLFLILINRRDYFSSWKLKRARDLLVSEVSDILDAFDPSGRELIDFQWQGATYQALAATVFVVKE